MSQTLPAAVAATRADGTAVRVHFATRAPKLDDRWRVVELRSADGANPVRGRAGETITIDPIDRAAPAAELALVAPYASGSRLMLARLDGAGTVEDLLRRHGDPIRYGYVTHRWPLEAYQNVYARVPGSAEMPSAGRPFTHRLISASPRAGSPWRRSPCTPASPRPSATSRRSPRSTRCRSPRRALVNLTHEAGGRVIAVGTTVVRALETVARADGSVTAGAGWTSLVIDPDRGVCAVDGLITGWHEPEASHLSMLAALAGEPFLERCTTQRWTRATCGTSSATATSSCGDRRRPGRVELRRAEIVEQPDAPRRTAILEQDRSTRPVGVRRGGAVHQQRLIQPGARVEHSRARARAAGPFSWATARRRSARAGAHDRTAPSRRRCPGAAPRAPWPA